MQRSHPARGALSDGFRTVFARRRLRKTKTPGRQLAAPTLAPSSLVDCQNLNLAVEAFHRVGTPVPEGHTRSIDQIPNGACRQDLPGAGKCHDAGGKMQGDPREAVTPHLPFADMHSSA